MDVLERASASLRTASGRDELFLVPSSKRHVGVSPVTTMQMDSRLNEFAAYVNVPLDRERPWHFSTHQFRKTFARFIARRDRSQLLALADHFKHASVAMTAKGYVGNDFDLHELVDHESQVDTAKALDRFLCSDQLAGRMGERIASRNAMFRGRAGEQVRRDYVLFVLKETDLRIHACDYGWCVFQQEMSRCGGNVGPNEIERNPAIWVDCANFVVEPKHAPYWQDRKQRNAGLYEAASPLTRAALDEAITQCDRVLSRIGEGQNVKNHNRKPHERTASSKAMLAYRAALDRLLCGKPTHPAFANRPIRITPASVAREAGRSRNPLYSTHRSFLIEIQAAANQRSVAGACRAKSANWRMQTKSYAGLYAGFGLTNGTWQLKTWPCFTAPALQRQSFGRRLREHCLCC